MKTLINEFIKGRSFDIDENGIGTLYDEDEGDIINIDFNNDNNQWEIVLFLNEEQYDREEIFNAEIDEVLKLQLLKEFEHIQYELDSDPDSPNYQTDLEISSDGLNFV